MTQGGPLSPTIFNLMVDAVIGEWLRQVVSAESARDGITSADIRRLLACFCADDGLVLSRDPAVLQRAFDALTGLFDRVGLRTNTKKTEVMIMFPGEIRTCLSADAYRARMDAEFREGWKGGEADCDICGATLKEVSLRKHLETQHDVYRSFTLAGPAAEPPNEAKKWAVWR